MATSDVDLQQIEVLWDRFKERLVEDPDALISDFAAEHPESAEEIKRVFPVMRELDSLADDQREDKLPEVIGRYPIIGRIAVGGMGVVYEARCEALRERIALKVISADRLDPKNIKRFEQEARAVASLHHTNIVPIYEFAQEEDNYFYTMRYIDGPNLAEVTRIAELSAQEDFADYGEIDVRAYQLLAKIAGNWNYIAEIGQQAALALEHAHSKEVLHRDIKPANLLVDNTDKLWVTDFGLAKRVMCENELTSIFQTVGTPRYMAPEQAKGYADHRSDIYSLGLTLHEIVTLQAGETPYRHSGVDTPPPPKTINSRVPAELNNIIVKAIQPDPANRYQSAKELANDLEKVARTRRKLPSKSKSRQIPWLLGACGCLIALLLSMPFWGMVEGQEPTGPTQLPKVELSEGKQEIRGIPKHLLTNKATEIAGDDAGHFVINRQSGQLEFAVPTDYEVPIDRDMNNVYEVAFKRGTGPVTHTVKIHVMDVNEPPTVDPFVFERDGETIRLSGKQLAKAWVLGVKDDQDSAFDGLFYELLPSKDRPLVNMTPQGVFVFDRRIASGEVVDANQDGVVEVELAVSDQTQCWMVRLEDRPDGKLALIKERVAEGATLAQEEISKDCLIRRDVIDIATADGKTFFHIHPNGGHMSLWKSTLVDGVFKSKIVNAKCGLPAETVGLATCDGETFYAILRIRGNVEATRLVSGKLHDDGTFDVNAFPRSSGLPISVTGFACLDGTRFHHIRDDAFGQSQLYFSFLAERFANMPLSAEGSQFRANIRGQAAWIERGEQSQKIVVPLRFDTTARR